jgi:hypothetical protein
MCYTLNNNNVMKKCQEFNEMSKLQLQSGSLTPKQNDSFYSNGQACSC